MNDLADETSSDVWTLQTLPRYSDNWNIIRTAVYFKATWTK